MGQLSEKENSVSDYASLQKSSASEIRTLAQAQSRIFELEKMLEGWEQERSILFQSIMRRDVELSVTHHALQDSVKTCNNLTAQTKMRLEEIVYLTKRTIVAEDRVEELIASTSWKITAPARKVVNILRRLRG